MVNFEPTNTNVEQEGLSSTATNNKTDATNNDSVNQTQRTNLNSHELFDSKLTGIFSTMNQSQTLDKEARTLLSILITSMTSLHQKWVELHNQVKELNRDNNKLEKEIEKKQRPMKRKYEELFGEFNALKQESAQICQHIDGKGENQTVIQEDRYFKYSDGSTKTIDSGLINSGWICYANSYLQVIASLPFLPPCLRTSPDTRMQHYGSYYVFATVISSLAGGSQIPIDPMDFMTKFHQHNPFFSREQHM